MVLAWRGVAVLSVVLAGVLAGCNQKVCEPGAVSDCATDAGCRATQTCDARGETQSACTCEPPCDAVAQTGCRTGEKCVVTASAAITTTCEPDGVIPVGGSCTPATRAATGSDECEAGSMCLYDTCIRLCDPSTRTCGAGFQCDRYGSLFTAANVEVAGGCSPKCDPVTQLRAWDGAAACGSSDTANPTRGCYGTPAIGFTCSRVGDATRHHGDDALASGTFAFLNGCAAGYLPLMQRSSTDSTTICVAACAPGPTNAASPANPDGVAPHTCAARGATGTVECRYMHLIEGASATVSSYGNTTGVCVNYGQYTWDNPSDGSAVPVPWPSCTTRASTDTDSTGYLDDVEWGCVPAP